MNLAAWTNAAVAMRQPVSFWQRLARLWPAVRFARPPRRLRVIETLQLGEKRQLLVVSIGNRELLIGAAPNLMATLAELKSGEKEADPA